MIQPHSRSLHQREVEDFPASSEPVITYCVAQRRPTANPAHALVVRGLQQGSSKVGCPYRLLLVPTSAHKGTWLYRVKDAGGN